MNRYIKLNMTYKLDEPSILIYEKNVFIKALDTSIQKFLFVTLKETKNFEIELPNIAAVIKSYKVNDDNSITFKVVKLETPTGNIFRKLLKMDKGITLSPRYTYITNISKSVVRDLKILCFYVDKPLDWIEKVVGRNYLSF